MKGERSENVKSEKSETIMVVLKNFKCFHDEKAICLFLLARRQS